MIRMTMPSGLCIECDEPHEALAVMDRFMPMAATAAVVETVEAESETDSDEDTAMESSLAPPKKSKQRRRAERLRKVGHCTVCGKPSDGAAYCDACAEKRNVRRRKSSDQKQRGTRSNPKPGTKTRRLIDWLVDNGPARPNEIAKAIDVPPSQVTSLLSQYRDRCVHRNDDGTYEAIVEKTDEAPIEETSEVDAADDEPFVDDPLPDNDAADAVDTDDAADDDAEPEQVEPPPLRRVERPPDKPRQAPGAFARYRQAAVDYLTELGKPAMRSQVCKACGIPKGSMSPVFADERFTLIGGEGENRLLWLADASPSNNDGRPSKPSAGERLSLPEFTGHVSSAADRAADTVAAELCVADRPLFLAKLARLTKFDPKFLVTVLQSNSKRFESTPDGYQLARK